MSDEDNEFDDMFTEIDVYIDDIIDTDETIEKSPEINQKKFDEQFIDKEEYTYELGEGNDSNKSFLKKTIQLYTKFLERRLEKKIEQYKTYEVKDKSVQNSKVETNKKPDKLQTKINDLKTQKIVLIISTLLMPVFMMFLFVIYSFLAPDLLLYLSFLLIPIFGAFVFFGVRIGYTVIYIIFLFFSLSYSLGRT
ncbi:MAG: hypothetical protein GY714_02400 [Desulfobacterales bacterium]|nr:hypothetical protein [Desulfobacterales bacterium]